MFSFVKSLSKRMMLLVLLLQVLLFPLLFGGFFYFIKKGYEEQFVNHARSDAYILASSVSSLGDYFTLDEALLTGRVIFAEIMSETGDLLYSMSELDKEENFVEDFVFGGHGDNRYNMILHLTGRSGEDIGVLRLSYDEIPTNEQIESAFSQGLMFLLLYLAVSILATAYAGRRLTGPIENLRDLSRDIAHGQYHQAITTRSRITELNDLAETLEFMRSELVQQSESMEHQALHDSLTGLPNRALLHDRIDQALYHPYDAEDFLALVLIDLDHFKEVNDSFGHLTGDNVLMESAVRLRHIVRRGDTVARLGGDEFAILLPTANEESALNIARKIHETLSEPMSIDKYSLRIGASIGVVLYPEHGDDFESLLGNADIAMYAAKQSGGGVKLFSPEFSKDTFKTLTLASDLREAVKQGQFYTVYQPKLELKSNKVVSTEALVRWNHPEKGNIPPIDFIPVAERTGLIRSLTQIVLQSVIQQLAVWKKNGYEFSVSVNLSAYDLEDQQLPDKIVGLLKQYKVNPGRLELEITESAIINDPLSAYESLVKLSEIGIKVALDDFGTGYSSLSQLKKLPLSIIKIDRSFVYRMLNNESDQAIVKATISMAHDLGLIVVAEGPEDKQTLDLLMALHTDQAQGYYISKPLPALELESWLNKEYVAAI